MYEALKIYEKNLSAREKEFFILSIDIWKNAKKSRFLCLFPHFIWKISIIVVYLQRPYIRGGGIVLMKGEDLYILKAFT
jgi:hypothetical protein